MKRPNPDRKPYLGIRAGDLEGKWYAKFWNPKMAPLPSHIKDVLLLGPQAWPLGLELADAASLTDSGYQELESGFCVNIDGAVHVAVLTHMPRISPLMWDWWFAWHGSETQRYKLWYPKAHLYSEWCPPEASGGGSASDRDRYVGGTCFVDEYVGGMLGELSIQFLPPSQLGLDEHGLSDPERATAICARVGLSGFRLDWGYLIHYVRRVNGGAEMRSRFWMGGTNVGVRSGEGPLTEEAKKVVQGISHIGAEQARGLLVHCSQEMSHLAEFLPDIYQECKREHLTD
ncbi:MAG: DAPG hydrolase family protein [Candidatus Binataceae bacterium]